MEGVAPVLSDPVGGDMRRGMAAVARPTVTGTPVERAPFFSPAFGESLVLTDQIGSTPVLAPPV